MADSSPESSRPLESSRPPESSRPIGGGDIPPPTGADRPALERTRSLLRIVARNPKDVRWSDMPYVLAVVANGVREALEAVLRVEQAGGQRLEDYLKDPVTWREETFRMRLADAEARLSDYEQAMREADELLAGMWSYDDTSRVALAHTWPVQASDRLRAALSGKRAMTWRLNITDDGQTAWLVSEKHSVELHTNGSPLDYDLLREFAAWVNS